MGNIYLTESDLISLIHKAIKETDGDWLDDLIGSESDDEFQKRMKEKEIKKRFKKAPEGYSKGHWSKEYEKPYSPIKDSDLPLEKYLEMDSRRNLEMTNRRKR